MTVLPQFASAKARILRIVYTAETHGNLLPCSCPASPFGGLARRIGWVDSLRAASRHPLLVVDAGSLFPSSRELAQLPEGARRDLLDLHRRAVRRIGYDAAIAVPDPPRRAIDLPWLEPLSAKRFVVDGLRVIVAGVDERMDPGPAALLVRSMGSADLVLLLCAGDLHFAVRAAKIVGAQVAVASKGACFHDAVWREGVLLLGPGREGKYVGTAVLNVDHGKVRAEEVLLRAMDGSVQSDSLWLRNVEEMVLHLDRARPGILTMGE